MALIHYLINFKNKNFQKNKYENSPNYFLILLIIIAILTIIILSIL